jgi:hypothetical protein
MEIEFADLEKKFAPIIGQAILSFGNIEYFTFQALEYLPNDNIFNSAAVLSFTQRVDLIIEILKGRKSTAKINHRLITLLEKAKELAKTRNIIAHNPLLIDIYTSKKGEVSSPQICSYLNKKRMVTYQTLVDFIKKVEAVAEELNAEFIKVISFKP